MLPNRFRNKFILSSILLTASCHVNAASYQLFINHDYESPTAIAQVKKFQAEVGDAIFISNLNFKGRSGLVRGSATSSEIDGLPYGQIAYRFSPMFVGAINVTQPAWTNFRYPTDSFIRFNSTDTVLRDYDISPRIAFQPNEKLTLGLGFNANHLYDGQINFVAPPVAGPYGEVTNKASAWAYGFNAGITYMPIKGTMLTLSYYSKILPPVSGTSTWGPIKTRVHAKTILPAVWTGNYVQFFSEKFLTSLTIARAQWSQAAKYLTLYNTAVGDVPIPEYLYNSWTVILGGHYTFNNCWALGGGVMYNSSMQPHQYRSVGIPNYGYGAVAIAPEFTYNKNWVFKGSYAYVWGNTDIDMSALTGPVVGRARFINHVFDFSVAYKM